MVSVRSLEARTGSAAEVAAHALAGDSNLVRVVHQPIVSLEDGQVVGWEALSRFAAPVATEEVFLQASELGLGPRLEAHALALALRDLPRLGDGMWLSVNVSPVYLSDRAIEESLGAVRLDQVVIELTEHVPIASIDGVASIVERLRDRGARIAIDDAGSGYGGLALAHALAPELVKVDRSLVAWVDQSDAKLAVLETVVATAHDLGAAVVAEGVERPEELAILARIGVDLAQGFLLSPPRAGFPQVPARLLVGQVRKERRLRFGRELAAVADPVRTVRSTSGLEDGVVAVGVDQHGRALFVADWVAGRGRMVRPATEIPAGASLATCIATVGARGADGRPEPLVVVDEHHRVLGVVRVERAIALAARQGLLA
jgi:EAL domain-containing protein (putative c-di-GMP-specific phosphodiesterase class I)